MKVLVTGACGRIGEATVQTLHSAGHEVVATDIVYRGDLPVKVTVADLLLREGVYHLMEGVEAVVHLGNHPTQYGRDTQTLVRENVTMNVNVFTAAAEMSVKKIIFASTVQVIAGTRTIGTADRQPSNHPYLPLNEHTPANPGNGYALSKQMSEEMLRFMSKTYGFSAVAIRLPGITVTTRRYHYSVDEFGPRHQIDEGLTHLARSDAARLFQACVETDLPGYRLYFPAAQRILAKESVAEIIQRFFPQVPLRKPAEEMTSLVDVSTITRETGWKPEGTEDAWR